MMGVMSNLSEKISQKLFWLFVLLDFDESYNLKYPYHLHPSLRVLGYRLNEISLV